MVVLDCYASTRKKGGIEGRVRLNIIGEGSMSGALCQQAVVSFYVKQMRLAASALRLP